MTLFLFAVPTVSRCRPSAKTTSTGCCRDQETVVCQEGRGKTASHLKTIMASLNIDLIKFWCLLGLNWIFHVALVGDRAVLWSLVHVCGTSCQSASLLLLHFLFSAIVRRPIDRSINQSIKLNQSINQSINQNLYFRQFSPAQNRRQVVSQVLLSQRSTST